MTPSAAAAALRAAGSCRQCPVSCERVVYPAGCLEAGCSRLYSYEEHGRTWMGCLEGVFRAVIDVERFEALQRTKGGFGALRAAREPLPMCRCAVERTFEHRSDGPCVNPDFLLSGSERGYTVTAGPRGVRRA